MSHQFYKPAKTRLQRSELAVPASSPQMFEKALLSDSDYVFLDLEDAMLLPLRLSNGSLPTGIFG